MRPTARSLILDLLSTLRRGTMPVRALVEAGALLGIEENNIRVSLARLHASGRVERDERGRYRLGPPLEAMRAQLQGWRRLGERQRSWRGDWIGVFQARRGRGAERRRREHALRLLGFRELAPGLCVRPDNLRGGVEALRSGIAALVGGHISGHINGQDDEEPSVGRVFVLRGLDAESEREARGLWDAERLEDEARASLALLQGSEERLEQLFREQPAQKASEQAMAETFLAGGRVLRQLVRHPLLPAEILDPAPFDALRSAMKRYDEIGRGHWAAFFARHLTRRPARHQVPHGVLPLDSRFEATTLLNDRAVADDAAQPESSVASTVPTVPVQASPSTLEELSS